MEKQTILPIDKSSLKILVAYKSFVTEFIETHFVPLEGWRDVVAVQFINIVPQRTVQGVGHSFGKALTGFHWPSTLSRHWHIHLQLNGLHVAPGRSSEGGNNSISHQVENSSLCQNRSHLYCCSFKLINNDVWLCFYV